MVGPVSRTAGSRLALLAGAATAILGILGLAGLQPKLLVEIATIVSGLAMLGYGGAAAARVAAMTGRLGEDDAKRLGELGIDAGGYSIAQTAGAAGVILGILAILGVASEPLPAIATIVLGGALAYSAGSIGRMFAVTIEQASLGPMARVVAQERVASAVGGYALVGIGSLVLGILALVIAGVAGLLMLVAFLVLGVGLVGGAVLATGNA